LRSACAPSVPPQWRQLARRQPHIDGVFGPAPFGRSHPIAVPIKLLSRRSKVVADGVR
jgi:hypothetical protein